MFNKTVFLILVLALFYGCGGGEGTTTDNTPPAISSVNPISGAVGVATNTTVTATFSEAMNPSTIIETTFTLKDSSNNSVAGGISYDSATKKATFTPSATLSPSTYTATITTGVKDAAGNAMAVDYPWTFTTSTTTTVSFASSIQPIFTSYCISCHQAGQISSFLPLTTGVSYGNLINIPATNTASGGTRVIPSNSADSVLYKRISGSSVGAQMPKGLTPLGTTDQNLIKTWIDEGANDN